MSSTFYAGVSVIPLFSWRFPAVSAGAGAYGFLEFRCRVRLRTIRQSVRKRTLHQLQFPVACRGDRRRARGATLFESRFRLIAHAYGNSSDAQARCSQQFPLTMMWNSVTGVDFISMPHGAENSQRK